jgi:hypothetical protein
MDLNAYRAPTYGSGSNAYALGMNDDLFKKISCVADQLVDAIMNAIKQQDETYPLPEQEIKDQLKQIEQMLNTNGLNEAQRKKFQECKLQLTNIVPRFHMFHKLMQVEHQRKRLLALGITHNDVKLDNVIVENRGVNPLSAPKPVSEITELQKARAEIAKLKAENALLLNFVKKIDLPEEALECPLSVEMIKKPVVDQFGHAFDKATFEQINPQVAPLANKAYCKDRPKTMLVPLLDTILPEVVRIFDAKKELYEKLGIEEKKPE